MASLLESRDHVITEMHVNIGQEDLLARNANINCQNHDGFTPLHLAASRGHQQCMQALLKSGADVAAVDNAGNTPIHIACAMNGSWHGWDSEVEKQRPAWESPEDKLARARRLKLIDPKKVDSPYF